jgi:hypothetical protein
MDIQANALYVECTPTEAVPHIEYCIRRKRAFMLHGSPSTAKSFTMRQICDRLGLKLVDCRLTQYDSVDLRGLPRLPDGTVDNPRVDWIPPSIMPREGDPDGVLFLDELPNSDTDVQAASYQLVLDRKLGEYELPDNWTVCAAGNYRTDMALVNQMASALKNRFIHLHLRTETNDFAAYASANGFHPAIIGFVRWAPEMLHAFQENSEEARQYIKNAYAFHTTRTWEMASDVLNDFGTNRFQECFPLIAGSVGLHAATKLQGFIQYYDKLPDLDKLFQDPSDFKVPAEMQTRYALTAAIAQRTDYNNFDTAMEIMEKMPKEMQGAFVTDVIRNHDDVSDHPKFAEWATKNSKLLF